MTKPRAEDYDHVGALIDYENGLLTDEQTDELFQYLVDSGLAWNMQGTHYSTFTRILLRAGRVFV